MKAITDKPIISIEEDLLSITKYAEALSNFILSSDTPITIGLQGEWGTGKTSLMGILLEILSKKDAATSWVNTWEYSMFRGANETTPAVLRGMLEKLEQKCKESGNWDIGDELSKRVKKVGEFLSGVANQIVVKKTGMDLARAARSVSTTESQVEIAEVKAEIAAIIEKLVRSRGNPYERVIFFVDDLDRIAPSDAVETLEALKNIFDIPHCVFILAIDYEVVVKGLESKFGKKTDENEREFRSFFDKIIQVPFTMPIGSYTIESFIKGKLIALGIEMTDEQHGHYAKVVRHTIGTNPRSLKRYLNSFSLINEVRAIEVSNATPEGRQDQNFTLFALLGIQISYPRIFRLLTQEPMFTRWDRTFANKHSFDMGEVYEKVEIYGENDLLDEEWEKVLWGFCQREPYLRSRAFEIISLLNLLRNKLGDELGDAIEDALGFASITAVDDDQGVKSAASKGKKLVFEDLAQKIAQLRELGLNEDGIVAYERLFQPLIEKVAVDNNYQTSLARTGASFNKNSLGVRNRQLLYTTNPQKKSAGPRIFIKESVGNLDVVLESLLAMTGDTGKEHLKISTDRNGRRELCVEPAVAEGLGVDGYLKLIDYIANVLINRLT